MSRGKIWLPGLKKPIGLVLSCPKEGMTFGRLPQAQSLKRAVPGEPTLRMGFGEDSFRGDVALHEGGVWNGAFELEIPNIPSFWGIYGH